MIKRMLHWRGPDFEIAIADDWCCSHCFRPLRPSAVRRDPGAVVLICEGCHGDLLRVTLSAD
jgi:hypothetical protein